MNEINVSSTSFSKALIVKFIYTFNNLPLFLLFIISALKLLCDKENLPALLNCAHGKDRTGIVSALVLACIGKSHDYIAQEYALSSVSCFLKLSVLCDITQL